MLASELFEELRQDFLEDWNKHNATDYVYKWTDSQLLRYLNEAIREACMRSPLLRESQTISVTAGTASYTLADETQEIDEITLALQTDPLIQSTHDQLTIRYGLSWRETTGTPLAFARKDLTITLYPEPIVADTMTVSSFRIPYRMYSTGQEPDIPEKHHRSLLYWCAYKAFLNPDIDLGSPERAISFLGQFERYFGIRKSAKHDAIQMNTPKYNTVAPRRMA